MSVLLLFQAVEKIARWNEVGVVDSRAGNSGERSRPSGELMMTQRDAWSKYSAKYYASMLCPINYNKCNVLEKIFIILQHLIFYTLHALVITHK